SNKPMMEKKRRARINSCLTQLKTLVLEAMKKDNSQYSKLEKADILELTVKHLKNVQRYQGNNMAQMPDAISKYRAGFNECANEVMRYLGESQGVNNDARARILSHLASILTPLNNLPVQQGNSQVILPALAPAQQQQHYQQLQLHHLQQQQQQGVFMSQATQVLAIDANNNNRMVSAPSVYRPPHGGNAVVSDSPTAFQAPVSTGMSGTASLQIPCIAATAMETTQFQLVPSNSGQVALVLTPQAIPAINVYATHQPARQQLTLDRVKLEVSSNNTEDVKPRLQTQPNPIPLVMKSSKLPKTDSAISGPYKRPISPQENWPTPIAISPSPHDLRKSYAVDAAAFKSVPLTNVSTNNSLPICSLDINENNNRGHSKNNNIVRATSTWRPW
ncbi:transcription factor HES-4-A, partial [Biomphalaria glabrata]